MSMRNEPHEPAAIRLQDAQALAAGYTPQMRRFEIAGIVTFFSLIGVLCVRLSGPAVRSPGIVALALFLGFLAADFVSGFVHWLADTWGATDTPVLGSAFIRPFREHHVDQESITRHDFVETNGANCIVSIPVAVAALFLRPGHPLGLFATAFLTSLILWVFATNQAHKWSHTAQPPALIAALQKLHLLLPRAHHSRHHTAPFNKYYCITVGWLNWPLYKLRFFEGLEWLITATTGMIPRQDDIGEAAARAIAPLAAPLASGAPPREQAPSPQR